MKQQRIDFNALVLEMRTARTTEASDLLELAGYRLWRQAFDKGEAGVF